MTYRMLRQLDRSYDRTDESASVRTQGGHREQAVVFRLAPASRSNCEHSQPSPAYSLISNSNWLVAAISHRRRRCTQRVSIDNRRRCRQFGVSHVAVLISNRVGGHFCWSRHTLVPARRPFLLRYNGTLVWVRLPVYFTV